MAGFDRVDMPAKGDEQPRRLTRAEFEALPLDQRVRAILSKKLRFYRSGKEVSLRDALDDG
jgi:hypothetical protein